MTTTREEQPQRRSLKRQRTKTATTTAAALLAFAFQTSPVAVHSFGSVTTTTSNTRTRTWTNANARTTAASSPTSVYFTVDEYHASHSHATSCTDNFFNSPFLLHTQQQLQLHQLEQGLSITSSSSSSSSSYDEHEHGEYEYNYNLEDDSLQQEQQQQEEEQQLPVWLRDDQGHLVQENIDKLRRAMLHSSSFFTESEAMKLTYAIRKAANQNSHKMAGAAEFCLIMVETMEMGLNALVAAAFHYCECVDARERSVSLRTTQFEEDDVDSLSHWEFRLPPLGIESFGDHAAQIERDAARLKRLEVVASMVVHNSNTNNNISNNNINNSNNNAAENLLNLYTTEAKDWRALAIRGAACLYRLRGILKEQHQQQEQEGSSSSKLTKEANRVCREAFRIYAPLASRMGMHRLKNELEHAAFQILYRRQHRTYESLLRQTRSSQSVRSAARGNSGGASVSRGGSQVNYESELYKSDEYEPNIGESMEEILAHVKCTMTEFLENDAVFSTSVTNFHVTARVKESYSTWKKMLRDGFDHITQVPDALALRIVLDAKKEDPMESDEVTRAREVALCYYAQQLCQTVWAPYEGDPRFKDYIAYPKENGYQSLHYTAGTKYNNEDWRMEVQVRSGEMHKVAEFGVASHWNYKAQSIAKPVPPQKKSYNVWSNTNNNGEQDTTTTAAAAATKSSSADEQARDDPFGKVTIANSNQSSDAYLRSLQEWHWQSQHGSSPVLQKPLILWDNEAESRERAERIRARTQRLAPYLEALANEQDDLQRKNVFVFLAPQQSSSSSSSEASNSNDYSMQLPTEGTVVALPAGASIWDAIRKCDHLAPILENLDDNHHHQFVTRNGTPASLTSRLQNGDVLSIPTTVTTSSCVVTA